MLHVRRVRLALLCLCIAACAAVPLTFFSGQPAIAQTGTSADLEQAVQSEILAYRTGKGLSRPQLQQMIINVLQRDDQWAWVLVGIVNNIGGATEGGNDAHFVLARYSAGSWTVAVEYTRTFTTWLPSVPDSIVTADEKALFASALTAQGNGSGDFSLPYAVGADWFYGGGPHAMNGNNGVRNSIDVSPTSSQSPDVLAAKDGKAYLACDSYRNGGAGWGGSMVIILHTDGYRTLYLHVDDLTVPEVAPGRDVARGEVIGIVSPKLPIPNGQTGLCGFGTGPHLHFSLKFNADDIAIDGRDIGGWTFIAGANNYDGTAQRVRDNFMRNRFQRILNEGTVGTNTPYTNSNLLLNPGFESGNTHWQNFGTCDRQLTTTGAHSGTQALLIRKQSGTDCGALFQDVTLTGLTGDVFTFSFWGKSTGRLGRLSIGSPNEGYSSQRPLNFTLDGQWRCYEVALTLTSASALLRPEMRPDSIDGAYLVVDDFKLTRGYDGCAKTVRSERPGAYNPDNAAYLLRNTLNGGAPSTSFLYGEGGADIIPLTGDWNGDGLSTQGIYVKSTGVFVLSDTLNGAPFASFPYGPGGADFDPVIGDWDGNGTDTVGVYNRTNGNWLLNNENASVAPQLAFPYGDGNAGYIPLAGDWDGDGIDTPGLFQPATSVFILTDTFGITAPRPAFSYGAGSTLTPVTGDWNGDFTDTVGLYNPVNGAWLLINQNASIAPQISFIYGGGSTLKPLVGRWALTTGNRAETEPGSSVDPSPQVAPTFAP